MHVNIIVRFGKLLLWMVNSMHFKKDETFELVSTLTFTPSAEENGETVTCLAINNVMEKPLKDVTILNIQCKFLYYDN